MKMKLFVVALAVGFCSLANATAVMPNFDGAPAGWTVDRYAPTSFSDVGTYQGRDDVLDISITSAGNLANRPAAYQSTFYNTQGMQHAISGGAGDSLSASLWIDASWGDASLGARRTDMWGVMVDGSNAVTDYPILGFTNGGGIGLFRYWDGNTGWVNLSNTVNYGGWNDLSISFSGSSFDYFVNGVLAGSDTNVNGSTGFSSVIMQAYNFADPGLGNGYVANNYTAHWSNATTVPEPGTLGMMGAGLFGIMIIRKGRRLRQPILAT